MTLVLDHLAVCCDTLAEGTAWVRDRLGVAMQPGGAHERYGTHNTLLGLGDGLYLEVIAIDPDATPDMLPRWFGLDGYTGPPRLANWICASDDLAGDAARMGGGFGNIMSLTRGAMAWDITVPNDGSLPHGGALPTLIAWGNATPHPSKVLADSGCRLTGLEVHCMGASHLQSRVSRTLTDPRLHFRDATAPRLTARFHTPRGDVVL